MNTQQSLLIEKIATRTKKTTLHQPNKKIRNCRDFLKFFHEALPQEFGYDATFFGRGIRHALGIALDLEITHNVPLSYLSGIRTTAGAVLSPPLSKWFASEGPSFFELQISQHGAWEKNFAAHGYRNIAIHGFTDDYSGRTTVFGIYNIKAPKNLELLPTLEAIAPTIHLAMQEIPKTIEREFHIMDNDKATLLTEREKEVAYWVSKGKSNSDIALILNISQHTVRNHLYNASLKISASNRSELVSLITHAGVN